MNTHRRNNVILGSLLAGAIGMAAAGSAIAQDRADTAGEPQENSEQPVGDTWITTKVKAELLATRDVSGLEVSVETVNGVVHLSGDVGTQAEADRAIAVARGVEGVTSVDSSRLNVTGTSGADGAP